MLLRFYAKHDQLVLVPERGPIVGQAPEYVGRRFDSKTRSFPATDKPYECESTSNVGRRLMKIVGRDRCLLPADEATARACNVPFEPADVIGGVGATKKEHAASKPKGKGTSETTATPQNTQPALGSEVTS